MSLCKRFGKDRVILVTAEDHQKPSNVQLSELDPELQPKGLMLPNGQINWNCPCLGNMVAGPCGFFFRQLFECVHKSKMQAKEIDCVDQFTKWGQCTQKYPNLYPQDRDNDMADSVGQTAKSTSTSTPSTSVPASQIKSPKS